MFSHPSPKEREPDRENIKLALFEKKPPDKGDYSGLYVIGC